MKKLSLLFLSLFMFGMFADELPANFSKYQAHYSFRCEQAEKCFEAFDKYMGSAEVEAMNLEVDFYAYEHQGWNGATHQVFFIIRMQMSMLWLEMFIQLPELALCSEIQ